MDETKLAQQLQKRSRRGLEQAIGQFTPYVSTVVWRTLGDRCRREDLEELVSDVFLALWQHAGELNPAQGLRPWLGTVARNKALDHLRKAPPPLPLEEDTPSPLSGPEEETEARERAEALWQAVEALGEPDATLFLRHYYHGEKLKDVAWDLGLMVPAAKARLSRGRKKLKEQLGKGGNLDG